MNDYLGRACVMLSRGRMEQRVLVLNPSTTGYLVPYEEERGRFFSDGRLEAIQNPDMTGFFTLVQKLDDGQWDFDLGDEYTMERHGGVSGRKLRVGRQAYDAVLISGDMRNLRASTAALLRQALDAGVKVLAVDRPGPYVEGLKDEKTYAELSAKWEEISVSDVDARLEALLGRRITAAQAFPTGMTHMRRVLDDGREVWFFVNHSFTEFDGTIEVPGETACEYRLDTGAVRGVAFSSEKGRVRFPLKLVRNQSAMIVVGETAVLMPTAEATDDAALTLVSIEMEQENRLPLSYCDVHLDGQTLEDVSVIRGGDRIFTARGFQNNPWDNKVQFRSNVMNRNAGYGPGSGFTADYRFHVEPGFRPETLTVTAEQRELCRLEINGQRVEWIPGAEDLDEHFGVADVAAYVRGGENVVTVVVEKFDVRMELETVYLRGRFDVIARDGRWTLVPPTALGYGSWRAQGRPFYSGAVVYRYAARLDKAPEAALLEARDVPATAVSAMVNGAEALLNADGRRPTDIAGMLKAGENEIAVRVCGSLKNLLGPHFCAEKPRGTAWPSMWKEAPAHQPAPDAWDLMDFDLDKAPTLKISR